MTRTRVWRRTRSRVLRRAQFAVLAVGVLAYGGLFEAFRQAPSRQKTVHRTFWVAVDGKPGHRGTPQYPLDLATALSAEGPVRPGDTVWVGGGTYRGPFSSTLMGTAEAPIIVRQAYGARATIDSASSGKDALSVHGGYTWFWGFEITSSDPKRRTTESGPWPSDLRRGYGSVTRAPGIRYINLVVHDNANGLGLWSESVGSDAYGNIIYNNGWQGPDRAHGHGIYTQNETGERRLTDNIIFNQFSHGIHAYGSPSAHLDNITIEGNIIFNNGALGAGPEYERNILVGGGRPAMNIRLDDNVTYYDDAKRSGENNVGYQAGCVDLWARGNYFVGARPLLLRNCHARALRNNTFYASERDGLPHKYFGNSYHQEPPTGTRVFVRRNRCESGRVHVAIYNWDSHSEINVDVAGSLVKGERYTVQDAQNLFGRPVAEGVFGGDRIKIPMNGLPIDPPIGDVAHVAHTSPRFGAFLVLQTAVSQAAGVSFPSECATADTSTLSDLLRSWGF